MDQATQSFSAGPAITWIRSCAARSRVSCRSSSRLRLVVLPVRNPREIEESFKAIVGEQPGALIVMGDRLFLHNRQTIIDFATKQGLPVVPVHPELVEAGGLMSYGPSYPSMHRRAAYFGRPSSYSC